MFEVDYADSIEYLDIYQDSNDNYYAFAYDVSLTPSTGSSWCDLTILNQFTAEWTVNTDDEASADPMFNAYYEKWALVSDFFCGGTYASDASSELTSGTYMEVNHNDLYCGFDIFFTYNDGLESDGSTVVTATTQVFTFYRDSALATTAASVIALSGLTALFL